MPKDPNHPLHIYERVKGKKEVYRCVHPECTHYNRVEYLIGKTAECFKCHEKFILTRKQLKNFHPVCVMCSKEKKSPTLKIGVELMENLFVEAEEKDPLNRNVFEENVKEEENAESNN